MTKEFLTIKSIGLTKLNNAEYLNLMIRLYEEIIKAGESNIGITKEYAMEFLNNIKTLTDVLAQNRANQDTATLQSLDQQRDSIWQHIITAIQNAQKSPISIEQEANKILLPEIKPYINKTRIPMEQETQLIRGFLLDMDKPANKPHLATLNLLATIIELNRINEEFATLMGSRALAQQDKLPSATSMRTTMDEQYKYITQKAYAMNLTTPTEKSTSFMINLNIFIEEVNFAYNKRMVQGKKEEDTTTDTQEEGNI